VKNKNGRFTFLSGGGCRSWAINGRFVWPSQYIWEFGRCRGRD